MKYGTAFDITLDRLPEVSRGTIRDRKRRDSEFLTESKRETI